MRNPSQYGSFTASSTDRPTRKPTPEFTWREALQMRNMLSQICPGEQGAWAKDPQPSVLIQEASGVCSPPQPSLSVCLLFALPCRYPLRAHVLIHTGEKPYPQEICNPIPAPSDSEEPPANPHRRENLTMYVSLGHWLAWERREVEGWGHRTARFNLRHAAG